MTSLERTELVLIALAALASAVLGGMFPSSLSPGILVLTASSMLLGQGLLRDLWVKYGVKAPAHQGQKIVCMCMESTVGMTGVIAGVAVLFAGVDGNWMLPAWFWPAFVAGMGVCGFVMKDLIIDIDNRSIRREKNHRSIIVW